ncbi:hypothetical protein PBCVNEJV1_345R [Paramecium bursaria Chlorella virus NE-JV-1]|nr:hypothetical protein PBCVNEJV1_345R [Paramecium bursaria Chlorella virus NE-JV-1]
MFHKVPGIISETGLTYEISDDWTVVSIAIDGKRRILKAGDGRVFLAKKPYMVYDVAKLAGLDRKAWSVTELEWEELDATSEGRGYRYRAFEDGTAQRMDQHGEETFQTWTKNSDGYFMVKIAGKKIGVHQMMGLTRFVPKPPDMPADWTVHHKNGYTKNNHYSNLVWASKVMQSKEQRPIEQHSIRSYPVFATALRDLVLINGEIIMEGETERFDNAYIAAAAIDGGNRGNISSCINGKLKDHAGFVWKTPPCDPDFDHELFESVGSGKQSERFVSTFGRLKYAFHNGYSKILFAGDTLTDRARRERDSYPFIGIDGKDVRFHRVVVEKFFGILPKTILIDGRNHQLIVDHVDDVKTNACIGNLQLLTQQENTQKRYLESYETSVASFFEGKYEYHKTRASAIEHVKARGYPDATLEELNAAVQLTADENIPAELYGRKWIRAHFETVVLKKS